jgi:hypothetical protein
MTKLYHLFFFSFCFFMMTSRGDKTERPAETRQLYADRRGNGTDGNLID